MRGFEAIEPVYTTMKGWNARPKALPSSTSCRKLAQEYLEFLERESGAKIGMVSTGPDRDQTMTLPEFRRGAGGVSGEMKYSRRCMRWSVLRCRLKFDESGHGDVVAEIFSALEAASRQEPGCVNYIAHFVAGRAGAR